jgi:hypothetical protein
MWPNPCFLSAIRAGAEVVCSEKGFVSNTGAGETIPTPSCAQTGDFQVIIFSFTSNTTAQWNTSGMGPEEGDWLVVSLADGSPFDETYSGGLPTNSTAMLMRRIVPGHQPFGFSLTGGGAFNMRYVTYILRGLDPTYHPLAAVTISGYSGGKNAAFNTGAPGNFLEGNPLPMHMYGAAKDVVVNHEHLTSSADTTYPVFPTGGNVLFADGNIPSGSGAHASSSIVQKFPKPWVDLLASKTWADWILTNLTDQASIPPHFPRVVYVTASAAARKGLRLPNVPLVAGTPYRFLVRMQNMSGTTGSGSLCLFMSVVDPQLVEHGVGSNETNTTGVRGTLVTTDAWSQITQGPVTTTSLYFTPVETGNYEIRLSMSRQDQLAAGDLDACTLSTSNGFRLCGFSLYADDTNRHSGHTLATRRDASWSYWDYVPRKILSRKSFDGTGLSNNNTSTSIWATLATTAERPPCEMSANWGNEMTSGVSADRLSVTATPVRLADIGSNEYFTWQSSTPVHPQLGDSFYFEVTINSTGTGRWGVYYAAPTHDSNSLDTTYTGDWYNHFMYSADGSARHWNTLTTGLKPLVAGDVLGVGIRFDTMEVEFTVNGELQTAMAMDADFRTRYCIWRAVGDLYVNGNATALYTVNFKGPFTYYGTAGAMPFDWANSDIAYRVGQRVYSEHVWGAISPWTVEYPAGTLPGDLIVYYLVVNGLNVETMAGFPADSLELLRPDSRTNALSGFRGRYSLCRIWRAGTEKSVTLTIPSGNPGPAAAYVTAYRNHNTTVPLGAIAQSGYTVNGFNCLYPSAVLGDPTNPYNVPGISWGTERLASNRALRASIVQTADPGGDTGLTKANIDTLTHLGPVRTRLNGDALYVGSAYGAMAHVGPTTATVTNLFDYSHVGFSAGWTQAPGISGIVEPFSIAGDDTATEWDYPSGHADQAYPYFSKVVNLTAGKWYTFMAQQGGAYYPFLMVDDGVNGPRGFTWSNNGGTGQAVYGAVEQETMPDTWVGVATAPGVVSTYKNTMMVIKAEITGPHTFMVGRGGGLYNLGIGTGSSVTNAIIGKVGLFEGYQTTDALALYDLTANDASVKAVTKGTAAGWFWPATKTSGSSRVGGIHYEIVPSGETPVDTRLRGPSLRDVKVTLSTDGLEVIRKAWPQADQQYALQATTMLPSAGFAGPGKYQFEIELTARVGSPGAWSVGVGVINSALQYLTTSYNYLQRWYNFWSYTSDGTACQDSNTATVTGLSTSETVGDIVTVAVDRIAHTVEFYKNGVLLTQLTSLRPDVALVATLSLTSTDVATTSYNRIRANFKGPFSYPVSGYSPYQWW